MRIKDIKDIRSILAIPFIYRLFSNIVGQPSARHVYVNDYIRPDEGDRILDIGCGPGDILEYLSDSVTYLGIDMSQEYIEAARKRFGRRGNFICQRLDEQVVSEIPLFDRVIAIGVLHHLEDKDALQLFNVAQLALKPGGRLITVDPVFFEGQPRLERYLVSKDRGEYVRSDKDYKRLIPQYFNHVETDIRSGLLHMPYSLMFMECFK